MRRTADLFLQNIQAADMDSDGDEDLVVVSGDGTVRWFRSDGSGEIVGVEPIADGLNDPRACGLGDLGGDGGLDAVISDTVDRSVTWRRNLGGGRFGEAELIVADTVVRDYATPHDVDGDGDLDVMYARQWQRGDQLAWRANDGGGGFGPEQLLGSGFYLQPTPYDGDRDLVIGNSSDFGFSRTRVGQNTGSAPYLQLRDVMELTAGVQAAHLVDLDGDGDDDVVWSRANDRIIAHVNLGAGTTGLRYGPAQVLVSNMPDRERQILAADMNGDGLTDLVVQSPWGVASGDLDGDGDLDIAYSGNNAVGWLRNDGTLGFAPADTILVNSQIPTGTVICADLDGDGDDDLVAPVQAFRRFYGVYEALGFGEFAAPVMVSGDLVVTSIQAADLEGDGDLDLVVNRIRQRRCLPSPSATSWSVTHRTLSRRSTEAKGHSASGGHSEGSWGQARSNLLGQRVHSAYRSTSSASHRLLARQRRRLEVLGTSKLGTGTPTPTQRRTSHRLAHFSCASPHSSREGVSSPRATSPLPEATPRWNPGRARRAGRFLVLPDLVPGHVARRAHLQHDAVAGGGLLLIRVARTGFGSRC